MVVLRRQTLRQRISPSNCLHHVHIISTEINSSNNRKTWPVLARQPPRFLQRTKDRGDRNSTDKWKHLNKPSKRTMSKICGLMNEKRPTSQRGLINKAKRLSTTSISSRSWAPALIQVSIMCNERSMAKTMPLRRSESTIWARRSARTPLTRFES